MKKDYTVVSGFNFSVKSIQHHNPDFSRNILDQDGEGFEPWYPDADIWELSHGYRSSKKINKHLSFQTDLYNSLIYQNAIGQHFSNLLYYQSDAEDYTPLYRINWQSDDFSSGLFDNMAGLEYQFNSNNTKFRFQSKADVTLDGFQLLTRIIFHGLAAWY